MDAHSIFGDRVASLGEPELVTIDTTVEEIRDALRATLSLITADAHGVAEFSPIELVINGRKVLVTGMHSHDWHLVQTVEVIDYDNLDSEDEPKNDALFKKFYLLPHSQDRLKSQAGRFPSITVRMSDEEFDEEFYNSNASEMRVYTFMFLLLQKVIKYPMPDYLKHLTTS
jgi:hypothetical protein